MERRTAFVIEQRPKERQRRGPTPFVVGILLSAGCGGATGASGHSPLISLATGGATGAGGATTAGAGVSGAGGAQGQAGNDGAALVDASNCKAIDESCSSDSECCSNICGAVSPDFPRSPPLCQ